MNFTFLSTCLANISYEQDVDIEQEMEENVEAKEKINSRKVL